MAKTRALLIGGSKYGQGLAPLKAPLNDVAALARVLRAPTLGHFDQVSTLLDPDPQTLREAVEELFCQSQKDDLALLFFSGHGLKDDRNRLYFATCLTRKTAKGTLVKSTAVPASFIQDQMGESRSRRQVVILDCCFSGAFAEGMTAKDDGVVNLRGELGGKGRVVLTSSSSTQYAFEHHDTDLSIYTHYLVQGIETGDADVNADGYTAIDELHDYACRKLQDSSPAMQPKIYAFDQGFRIHVARSPMRDPKRRYYQAIKAQLAQGPISVVGRLMLNEQRNRLGLSIVEAEAIEATILQPQHRYEDKRRTYQQAVRAAVTLAWPLNEQTQQELAHFQRMLGLTDDDAATIYWQVEQDVIRPDRTARPQPKLSCPDATIQPLTFITASISQSRAGLLGLGTPVLTVKRRSQTADSVVETLGGDVRLTLLSIPAGQFVMGSPGAEDGHWPIEAPQHTVVLSSFFMGQSAVTWAQWQAVTAYPKVGIELAPVPPTAQQIHPGSQQSEDHPVTQISWHEAVEFCQRLSYKTGYRYRLPSEAEWEYACRANTTTPFYFGDTLTPELAAYDSKGTTVVGSYPANAFGLYDMHGNVWEWCSDRWHEDYRGAPSDGTAWDAGNEASGAGQASRQRLVRGGSWLDQPVTCRSASRISLAAETRSGDLGFRVVCDLP